jgi:2-dehydropantoate 2-reductase
MKIAMIGAGAIGGFLGARLAVAGNEVVLVARGKQLRALQEKGVLVRFAEGELAAHPFATGDLAAIGPVDVVFLALKAHSLPELAPGLHALLGPDTPVIAGQNGLPWWYFERHGGPLEGMRLESVDPDGIISRAIPIEHVVGCVIYCSTVLEAPGVILHKEGNRIAIGEPDGTLSKRCENIAAIFRQAGLKCPVRRNLRRDIWVKLIGNLALNPVSALTGATLEQMTGDEKMTDILRTIMEEGSSVARAVGVDPGISIEQRLQGAAGVGDHKTSMLQDLEQGRPLELDSIVGSVIELADRLAIPVPCCRTVAACTRLLAKTRTELSSL